MCTITCIHTHLPVQTSATRSTKSRLMKLCKRSFSKRIFSTCILFGGKLTNVYFCLRPQHFLHLRRIGAGQSINDWVLNPKHWVSTQHNSKLWRSTSPTMLIWGASPSEEGVFYMALDFHRVWLPECTVRDGREGSNLAFLQHIHKLFFRWWWFTTPIQTLLYHLSLHTLHKVFVFPTIV